VQHPFAHRRDRAAPTRESRIDRPPRCALENAEPPRRLGSSNFGDRALPEAKSLAEQPRRDLAGSRLRPGTEDWTPGDAGCSVAQGASCKTEPRDLATRSQGANAPRRQALAWRLQTDAAMHRAPTSNPPVSIPALGPALDPASRLASSPARLPASVCASVLALVLALVLVPAAPAFAGGGFIVPPIRSDIAPSAVVANGDSTVAMHWLIGLHWASVTPNPRTRFDVGIGYTQQRFPRADHAVSGPSQGRGDALARSGDAEASDAVEPANEAGPVIHGAYLELSTRIAGDDHQRSWLGVRGALLYGDVGDSQRRGWSLTGRVAWEVFGNVKEGGSGGAAVGTAALGVFVETGVRELPGGQVAMHSTAGLSGRLPLIVVGK
jgi:hypothetical protein